MKRNILFLGLVLIVLILYGCTNIGPTTCSLQNPCPSGQSCTFVNASTGTGICKVFTSCSANNPCPSGQNCTNNVCVAPAQCSVPCSISSQCPSGLICAASGVCLSPCLAGNLCQNGAQCTNVELDGSGECAPSSVCPCSNISCPSGQTCIFVNVSHTHLPANILPGAGLCVNFTSCSSTNLCPSGQNCINNVCVTPNPHCSIDCGSSYGCPSDQLCSDLYFSTTGRDVCLTPCFVGNLCPNGASCNYSTNNANIFGLGWCTDPPLCPQSNQTNQSSTCPSGQTLCNGICVNNATDVYNCGKCGVKCPSGQNCTNGACVIPTLTNSTICTACSTSSQCPTNQLCINGACSTGAINLCGTITSSQQGSTAQTISCPNGEACGNTTPLLWGDPGAGWYNTLNVGICIVPSTCTNCSVSTQCPTGLTCQAGLCTNQTTNQTRCSDTDGGINFNVSGTATSSAGSFTDYCLSSNAALVEFYCLNGTIMNKTADCPYGCSNGACMNQTVQPNCTDTDGGVNYSQIGTVVSPTGNFTDFCSSNAAGNALVEYYCKGINVINMTVACPTNQTCTDGACITSPPACVSNGEACSAASPNCCDGFSCNAASGTCAPNCSSGLVACNGLCVNYANDPNNCGSCGVECSPGQNCTDGACFTPAPSCIQSDQPCSTGNPCCSGACNPLNNLCQ